MTTSSKMTTAASLILLRLMVIASLVSLPQMATATATATAESSTTTDAMTNIPTTATSKKSFSVAEQFYIVTREPGQQRQDLPVWASRVEDPFGLGATPDGPMIHTCTNNDGEPESATVITPTCSSSRAIERHERYDIPGAFQLFNFMTREEAQRIVDTFEDLGFTEDASVSVPRKVRHNLNMVWIADNTTLEILWNRCQDLFYDREGTHFQRRQPVGLNGRFRTYKYTEDDYFKLHSDGSWAGSRVVNGTFVGDAFGDRWSQYSFLIGLSDEYEGGETEFLVKQLDPTKCAFNRDEATNVPVKTPMGGVLVFPHGDHPLHCLHSSTPIRSGIKYIIRADVLFEL